MCGAAKFKASSMNKETWQPFFLQLPFPQHTAGNNALLQYETCIHVIYKGRTNALICNKTLIQMSQTKTLKITPTCFHHQMIIMRELFDPG
jgi:hypothetical protein